MILGLSAVLRADSFGPAYRVKDINTELLSNTGGITSITVEDSLFFVVNGGQLWKSDGTAAGTKPVEGAAALYGIVFKQVLAGILYFTANDGGHGNELWRTDGTAEGTWMLRDILPGRGDSGIETVVAFRGELYFFAQDDVHGYQLWKSDGTKEGTVLSADFGLGSTLFGFAVIGDTLYFVGPSYRDSSRPYAVYTTDGTVSGLRFVRDFAAEVTSSVCPGFCIRWPPGGFVALNGMAYFVASDGASGLELWKTDGTRAGTQIVKDICPGRCNGFLFSDGPSFGGLQILQVAAGRLYFFADDGTHGMELWTSDGTEAGTQLVKDINLGSNPSGYLIGLTLGEVFFFLADDGTHGAELWRSNGTEEGTSLLADLNPGPEGSYPSHFTASGESVFFTAQDDSGQARLWKTDPSGSRVTPISSSGSNPTGLTSVGVELYFAGSAPGAFSLWKTDGTAEGTIAIRALGDADSSSNPQVVGEVNGALIFSAMAGAEMSGLWRSDGTEAGTQAIAPALFGSAEFPATAGFSASFRGSLFFSGNDAVHGFALWRTDGSSEGTRLVRNTGRPCAMSVVGDALYFGALIGAQTQGLWKSDGTEDGTVFIKDVLPDCFSRRPSGLVPFRSSIYFSGLSLSQSLESGLWRTDGTTAGTELVTQGSVDHLTALGDKLLFSGNTESGDHGLWTTDGTGAGTVLVKRFGGFVWDLVASRQAIFVLATNTLGRMQLWRADGSEGGTILLGEWDFSLAPQSLSLVGNQAFFPAGDADHGIELWTSDGTPSGTHLVKDIAPGAADSYPRNLASLGGVLLFSARDPIHGEELWETDGAEAGTFLVQDIFSGPPSSSPSSFTQAGSLVYFTADDGETGIELWAMPAAALEVSSGRVPRNTAVVPWRP